MDILNRDEILSIAICLKLSDLLNFSLINKKYFQTLEKIWICKLNREFEDFPNLNINSSYKDIYKILYGIANLKNKLQLKRNIYKLYQAKKFSLHYTTLPIPKEIRYLTNVKVLDLSYNKLQKIPEELLSLINLQSLHLYNNEIRFIPKEIQNLFKLKFLSLSNNKINHIPEELGNLPNLETLLLIGNEFSSVPEHLNSSPKLNTIYLGSSVAIFIPPKLLENKFIYIKCL